MNICHHGNGMTNGDEAVTDSLHTPALIFQCWPQQTEQWINALHNKVCILSHRGLVFLQCVHVHVCVGVTLNVCAATEVWCISHITMLHHTNCTHYTHHKKGNLSIGNSMYLHHLICVTMMSPPPPCGDHKKACIHFTSQSFCVVQCNHPHCIIVS